MTSQEYAAWLDSAGITASAVSRIVTHGLPDDTDESRDTRLRRWAAVMRNVEAEDAERCLRSIEAGQTTIHDELKHLSDWADRFPAWVSRWCRHHRMPKAPENAKWGDAPRVHCVDCLDRGIVITVNPAYVAAHRRKFKADEEPIDPYNRARMDELREWFADARLWCRRHGTGPLVASAVCDCEHRVAQSQRQRIAEHRDGCAFKRSLMPVVDSQGPLGVWQACVEFVRSYTPTESYEQAHAWAP